MAHMKPVLMVCFVTIAMTANLGCQSKNQNTVAPPTDAAAAKTEEMRQHYSNTSGGDQIKKALEAAQQQAKK